MSLGSKTSHRQNTIKFMVSRGIQPEDQEIRLTIFEI